MTHLGRSAQHKTTKPPCRLPASWDPLIMNGTCLETGNLARLDLRLDSIPTQHLIVLRPRPSCLPVPNGFSPTVAPFYPSQLSPKCLPLTKSSTATGSPMAAARNRAFLPNARRSKGPKLTAVAQLCRTIAKVFSEELMNIFRIDNSVADLDEQVDKRSVAGSSP